MSYDSEQIAITEFRLQITSMLFLSSAISSTSLMEEVFTSVDRISRLQNRLVSLLILILKSIKLSYSTSLRRAGSTKLNYLSQSLVKTGDDRCVVVGEVVNDCLIDLEGSLVPYTTIVIEWEVNSDLWEWAGLTD
ncbi:hypothetical protein OSB04_019338 [Centaurea solstitialis]|uniref:Uncharacterized protein n=1 Tax=Centaurea solstitialis TaxID=347529 RepID=A0AA38SQ45_9ASTR|nr:hypothetical protein OSB04_019338 [Centaurea solstitialis]